VVREFYNSDFSLGIDTHHFELALSESISVLRIETVVTAELLLYLFLPICPVGNRAWRDLYPLGLANKRTGELTDHQARCVRGSFLVLGILDTQDVPRILYQSMLKTSSGANERPAPFPGKPDSPKGPVHIVIRAAWSTPKCVKPPQRCRGPLIVQRLRRQPRTIHSHR